MKKSFVVLFLFAILILSTENSCKKEDNLRTDLLELPDGIFISNEGPFQAGTGTISFYKRESGGITNNIFENVNGRPLGNIVQSIEVFNGKAYIVVNNASKVEVAEASTFKSLGTIDSLTSPRYFLGVNENKGYITDWADNVAVIDLDARSVTKTIAITGGPEKMLKQGDRVFVISCGGWDVEKLVTVIDTKNDSAIRIITVADRPTGIVEDNNGKIWVMCSGKGFNGFPAAGDTKGHLICINPSTYSIEKDFEFPVLEEHPEKLVVDKSKNKLYYNHPKGVFELDINASSLPSVPIIPRYFYALGFDPASGLLFVSDPIDYSQNGWVLRINPVTKLLVDSFQVGVTPNEFCFN